MNRIAIVTDSAADLPPALAAEYDISVIPLNIHWGGETYLDGVTLDAATFYRWLEERPEFPKTSQPALGAFVEFFRSVAERYATDTILGVFVTGAASGTVSSAQRACADLPDLRIEVIDSQLVSMGEGFQALAAAQLSRAGAPLAEIKQRVLQVRDHTNILLAVNTLENLYRGGRIGGAARLVGTALNLKPVLTFREGRIEPVAKVRSRRKSLERIIEEARRHLGGRRPVELAVMYTPGDTDMEILQAKAVAELRPQHLYTGIVAPVLGAHGGPGVIGIGYYPELD